VNRRRVASLLRALAEEIDEPPARVEPAPKGGRKHMGLGQPTADAHSCNYDSAWCLNCADWTQETSGKWSP
jgi:hypothetical protein